MNGKRGIPKGRGLFSFIGFGDNWENIECRNSIRNKKQEIRNGKSIACI
jgi:hypothetical protein